MRTAVLTTLTVSAFSSCKQMGGMPGVPGAASCPKSPAEIMSANFGLDAQLEGKVKAGLAAAASFEELAAKIEGQVTAACGKLAMDLGATEADLQPKEQGPGKKAEAACQAATKLIGEMKAKASGQLSVEAKPPRCTASMSAMADCAASCDANVQPGSAEVKCEGGDLSGQCDAECNGTCTVEAGAECKGSCSGECSGSCDASFSGKCDGKCEGTCDGKNTQGKCAGTCEGKCTANASGSCGGKCEGTCSASCDMEAKGSCSGTCTGECSVEMKAPSCTGEVKPPEMSAECKANCDAQVSGEVECTKPQVIVSISGAADMEAATKLQAALRANLPALIQVTVGMKDTLARVSSSVQASVEGLQAVVQGGGDAALKVGGCVAAALEAQVQASMSVNVSVQASASVSGSASAG
jgi:hypothetical protein